MEVIKIENSELSFMKDFEQIFKFHVFAIRNNGTICVEFFSNTLFENLDTYQGLEKFYHAVNNMLGTVRRLNAIKLNKIEKDDTETIICNDDSLLALVSLHLPPLYEDIYGKTELNKTFDSDIIQDAKFKASFTRKYNEYLYLYSVIIQLDLENKEERKVLDIFEKSKNFLCPFELSSSK